MPRLHLETTADLSENDSIPEILSELVEVFSGIESVDPASLKAYHSLRSVWVVGAGHPEGFVHLTANVLSGRSLELRKAMSQALWTVLNQRFRDSVESGAAKLTVEIREMERDTYGK